MGSNALSKRAVWQDIAMATAKQAEDAFFNAMRDTFKGTNFEISPSPEDFTKIYVDYPLEPEEQEAIYSPPTPVTIHGMRPDFCIEHKITNKKLFVEIKKQNGWVEGGTRSDGRGNVHERAMKYFAPGLLKILRKESKISKPALPFWIVFRGDITRDPCRVREITCWFDEYTKHYFFWRENTAIDLLTNHFNNNLKELME